MHIQITDDLRDEVREQIRAMRSMSPDDVPPITDNPEKCTACSARPYCLPEETLQLEPDRMPSQEWEEYV
ncbi:hypothetical protein GCM10009066_09960 [Halarchaeum salinum]|uniref:Dna2/Cas4 domain-containing protein n=1 Tax=Halarchaeum salinum TaxID=489912 RepID=A0AAV3S755_9EURY